MANAVSSTINHGVALIIGFVMALILEEVVEGQFTDGSILSIVADNITVLYIVLVLALFATRMSTDATQGQAPM